MDSTETDCQSPLTPDADSFARLIAELARQQTALQETELSLVNRIGDVDDDRRQSNVRLQRACQSRHSDVTARLKRHRTRGVFAWLFLVLLNGLALFMLWAHLSEVQQVLREEIVQLRLALDHQTLPSNLASPRLSTLIQDTLIEEKLSRLSTSIRAISTSLDQQPPEAAPALAPDSSAPTADATPAPEPSAADAAASTPTAPDAQILLTVGDQNQALQLASFNSLDALQAFLERFKLTSQVVYYREETQRGGRLLFTLIHSLYTTREAAAAAISKLPAGLAERGTWVRKLDPQTTLVMLGTTSD